MSLPAETARSSFWRRYVNDVADEADDDSAAYLSETARSVANRKAVVVAITAAVALTALNFGATSGPSWAITLLGGLGFDGLADRASDAFFVSRFSQFNRLVFWGSVQVVSYVAIPLFVIRFVLRERVGDYGLAWRGIGSQGRHYLILLAVAIPFVVAASFTGAFQSKYPFYDLAFGEGLWPRMWIWWGIYALQFVALEFFFRGFLVQGLKWRMGYLAIFVMIIPYNMIHFNKPVAEALAAIVGGTVLGTLSMKTRSIWLGAALHISIAALMDVMSLTHRGLIF